MFNRPHQEKKSESQGKRQRQDSASRKPQDTNRQPQRDR